MKLIDKYTIARWAYSIGSPIMEDYEYNLLHEQLSSDPEYDYITKRSWSDDPQPVELLIQYEMFHLLVDKPIEISEDKSESIKSITKVSELEEIEKQLEGRKCHYSAKADGFNVQIVYEDGNLTSVRSRGRVTDSIDFSVLKCILPTKIPLRGTTKIYGECVTPKYLFEIMRKEIGVTSIRSSVSAAIARHEYTPNLKILTFEIISSHKTFNSTSEKFRFLDELGFDTPEVYHTIYKPTDALLNLNCVRDMLPYQTDGIVLRSDDSSGNIKYALRFGDWAEPVYISYIKNLIWETGPVNGVFKAEIFPIRTASGSKQSVLNLYNLATVIDYKLYKKNALVAFTLRSHSIASVDLELSKILNQSDDFILEAKRSQIEYEEQSKDDFYN